MAKLPQLFNAPTIPTTEPSDGSPAPIVPGSFAEPLPPTEPVAAAEPASLPQDDPWNAPAPQSAPTRSRNVLCHINDLGVLVIDSIPDGFTEEEAELIQGWYPTLWQQPSVHVTNPHGVVITGEDVLVHLRAEAKAMRAVSTAPTTTEERQEKSSAHMQWIEECGARKQRIADAKAELARRNIERKTALAKFNAEWEEYVNAARLGVQDAEAEPVPKRPL